MTRELLVAVGGLTAIVAGLGGQWAVALTAAAAVLVALVLGRKRPPANEGPTGPLGSKELVDEEASLREFLGPKAATERLDKYGTWLFGLVAVLVGLASAGIAVDLFEPAGWGHVAFGLSIAAAGAALAFASLSMAPKWAQHQDDLETMRGALNQTYARRRGSYVIAALFAAIALFFAGLTPLLSQIAPQQPRFFWEEQSVSPAIQYDISGAGEISIKIDGVGLDPFSEVSAWLVGDETPECGQPPPDARLPIEVPVEAAPSPVKSPLTEASPGASPNPSPESSASPMPTAEAAEAAEAEEAGPPVLLPAFGKNAGHTGEFSGELVVAEVHVLGREPRLCLMWTARNQAAPTITGPIDFPIVPRPTPASPAAS